MPGIVIALEDLDGSNGFTLIGGAAYDSSGFSVSGAGDINGDGFDDILIGAPYAHAGVERSAGKTYVLFGRADGFDASVDLDALNGQDGFVLDGIHVLDRSGWSVSGAGDVNGDGFDDLMIGAPWGQDSAYFRGRAYQIGATYVVFGREGGFGGRFDLSTLTGDNGFIAHGVDVDDRSGRSVSAAGDINGDGFDDIIIGADMADPDGRDDAGEGYVVFGRAGGFDQYIDLADLDGETGFALTGGAAGDRVGFAVSGAGDVNGDGLDDVIVGAVGGDPNGIIDAGETYVVFGRADGFDATVDLSTLDGRDGFAIIGLGEDDFIGRSVGTAGDINGDGIDDLVIGARSANPDGREAAGEVYVVFGRADGFAATVDPSRLDGTDGFVLEGGATLDSAGYSVSGAGDVNGDGFDDLIVGALGVDSDYAENVGMTYVLFGGARGFDARLDLSAMTADDGFALVGAGDGDSSGASVSGAGDVNGDGFDDLIVAAPWADPDDAQSAGESYVIFGSATIGRPAPGGTGTVNETAIARQDLEEGRGFVLTGLGEGDASGFSVGDAGDVNGDGFDDIIVGAPVAYGESGYRTGQSYVVFGGPGGISAGTDLNTLDGSNGFVLGGTVEDSFNGFAVDGAGDVNGDGFDDIIVGAYGANPDGVSEAGISYVVFGKAGGFADVVDLRGLDGGDGFAIFGIGEDDFSGWSVSGAGDVNGDGFDDVVIGAGGADPDGRYGAGAVYVVFGKAGGFDASLDLADLNGGNGFVLEGGAASDYSGWSVSGAGDVNGDGFDDIIAGAPGGDPGGRPGAGETYVIFGKAGGFDAVIDPAALDGRDGFVLTGFDSPGYSGRSVGMAGDINGDGFDDLIVGAPLAGDDAFAGEAYVVFGTAGGFDARVNLAGLDGGDGFVLEGGAPYDRSGIAVSGAGDVNGDGFDDLIVAGVEKTHIIFGKADGFGTGFSVDDLTAQDGLVLDWVGARYDQSVSGAGDVNGDGFDDLIIGDFAAADGPDNAGATYVIFGARDIGARYRVVDGDTGNDTLDGDGDRNRITGDAGGDRIRGRAGNDTLEGGSGDDLMVGGTGDDLVLGGTGDDTVYAGAGDEGADRVLGGAGADLLAGGGGGDHLVGDRIAADAAGTGGDTLYGGAGDDTLVAGSFDDRDGDGRHDSGETVYDAADNVAYGGAGADLLIAGAGDDTMGGGTGADRLFGHGGDDIFYGGRGAGDDTVEGGGGNDTIFAGAGDDAVDGGGGADALFGGAGADVVRGGAGGDSLYGAGGDDVLTGGDGADRFFFADDHGDDTVRDFEAGEDQLYLVNTVTDFATTADVRAAAVETVRGGASGLLIDTGGGNSLFLEGIARDDLSDAVLVL